MSGTHPSQMQNHNRNQALDGVRGLAVGAVVLYHGTMTLGFSQLPLRIATGLLHAGWLGVEVFFALSGFLITGILMDSRDRPLGAYLTTFYYRRSLRIFPLYYGVIAIMLILPQLVPLLRGPEYTRFVQKQWWLWSYGACAVREYFGPAKPILEFGWFEMTHFWTLAVEEHFYLCWPLVVYLLSARRSLMLATALLLAASTALRSNLISTDTRLQAALFSTPRYVGGLALGALGAQILRSPVNKDLLARVARATIVVALLLLAALALRSDRAQVFVPTARGWMVSLLVGTATTAAVLYVSVKRTGRLHAVLTNRILVGLGTYSYGIYVYHHLLGPWQRAHFPHVFGRYAPNALLYLALFVTIPLVVALVSYHLFELPILRLKGRHFGPNRQSSSASQRNPILGPDI